LASKRDLRVIVELLPFLPPPTSPYGDAAALAVKANVEAASPEEVASFDQWYRDRTCSGPPRPSWEDMGVGRIEVWARQHFATVAIATCHRSGFVRQKAVEALAGCPDGIELPFLLVRLNDWVPEVRAAAEEALRARLHVEHARSWVRCLGLLARLRLGGRGQLAAFTASVEALLARAEARPFLEAGLRSGSVGVRRACLRIVAGSPDSADLLRVALRDPDPVTSWNAARVLCKALERDSLREVLTVMQRGNARARCLALETLCERFQGEAEPHLRAGLLDPAAIARELARFKRQKTGLTGLEFATFYREQLDVQRGALFVTALRGLAETGTAGDAPVLAKFVAEPRAAVREAAVLGLGRCDGEKQVERLVAALGDPNLRVVKAAHRYAKLYLGRGAVPKRPPRPERITASEKPSGPPTQRTLGSSVRSSG